MNRHWLNVLCCLGWLLAATAALAYPNEPEGFRGVPWGARIEESKADMTLAKKEGEDSYYTRKDDKNVIGEAELSSIVYGYRNGRFSSVIIQAVGEQNKAALIRAFREQYGPGSQPSPSMDKYAWRGAVATISLECETADFCQAILFATALVKQ